jgi:hypothetical protein
MLLIIIRGVVVYVVQLYGAFLGVDVVVLNFLVCLLCGNLYSITSS